MFSNVMKYISGLILCHKLLMFFCNKIRRNHKMKRSYFKNLKKKRNRCLANILPMHIITYNLFYTVMFSCMFPRPRQISGLKEKWWISSKDDTNDKNYSGNCKLLFTTFSRDKQSSHRFIDNYYVLCFLKMIIIYEYLFTRIVT